MERKNTFILYAVIGLILIFTIVGYVIYSNNIKGGEETEKLAKVEEDSSSISTEEEFSGLAKENTESVSTEIGKTISEAEKEIETKENNNKKETKVNNEEKKEETQKEENVEKKEEVKELKFIKPVEGEIINKFAKDSLIYSKTLNEWITHNGIDIKSDKTSVIKASEEGTVKSIKTDPRYGLTVIVSHANNYETVYSNLLTAEFVVEGENIKQGQTIGTVGNSGSFEIAEDYHLHFEMIKDGEYVDPEIYLK